MAANRLIKLTSHDNKRGSFQIFLHLPADISRGLKDRGVTHVQAKVEGGNIVLTPIRIQERIVPIKPLPEDPTSNSENPEDSDD